MANPYGDLINAAAQRYGLDPDKLSKQISKESANDPNAVSPKGALGLAQVMPATAREMGYSPSDMKDPALSIDAGARYMARMLKYAKQQNPNLSDDQAHDAALAAYNAGPGAARRYIKTGDMSYLPKETQDYVMALGSKSGDDLLKFLKSGPVPQVGDQPSAKSDASMVAFLKSAPLPKSKPATPLEQPAQPNGSMADQLGRQLGLTARQGIEGAGEGIGLFADPLINAIGAGVRAVTGNDYQPATVAGTAADIANVLGLPQPQTAQEKIVAAIDKGLISGGGAAKAAGGVASVLSNPVMQGAARTLAEQPVLQAAQLAAGRGTGEAVRQGGGGEGAATAAELAAMLGAGLVIPGAANAIARRAATADETALRLAQQPGVASAQQEAQLAGAMPEAQAAAAAPQSAENLGALTKQAVEGLNKQPAKEQLAIAAAPDANTLAAAERLGIAEHLQPDHVTTNQSYRELAQAIKSFPGSVARQEELNGLEQVAKRADELVAQAGGTEDMANLSQGVKRNMQQTQQQLSDKANQLYSQLREAIPAKAEAPADNVLAFIGKRADELGGVQNLSPMEKSIYAKLSPKSASVSAEVPANGQMSAEQYQALINPKPGAAQQPSYALLDDVRRDLTAARVKRQGQFADADSGLIKKLESELMKDQRNVVEQYGQTPTFDLARQTVAVRKGLEDDMTSLFGKDLQGSLVGDLSSGTLALAKGDTSRFTRLINAVPEAMRKEVATSALLHGFGQNAKNNAINFNSYAKWYEALQQNRPAYAALMKHIDPEARKQLRDLYTVSKGISAATKERITTGRLRTVQQEMEGPDNAISRVFDAVKRSSGAIAAGTLTTALGHHGAGLAAGLASALTPGKTPVMKAADALIVSPEFRALAMNAGNAAKATQAKQDALAKALADSRAWKRFLSKLPDFEQKSIKRQGVATWLGSQPNQQGNNQ